LKFTAQILLQFTVNSVCSRDVISDVNCVSDSLEPITGIQVQLLEGDDSKPSDALGAQ